MDKKVRIWLKMMRFGAMLGCHQRPERSFFLNGYQFPICARCTGIYAGYIGAVILWEYKELSYWVYCILLFPMAVDGITQYMKIRESTQLLRLFTGLAGGYGLLSIQIKIIVNVIGLMR